MSKHTKYLSYASVIGLLITYGLAISQAIDIKKPDPYLTSNANLLGSIFGWVAALIATGTFLVVLYLLNHYETENKGLRERLGETKSLYDQERWKKRS